MNIALAALLGALGPFALFLTSARLKPAAAIVLWLAAVRLYCVGVVPFVAPADGGLGPLWALLFGGACGSGLAWRVLQKRGD